MRESSRARGGSGFGSQALGDFVVREEETWCRGKTVGGAAVGCRARLLFVVRGEKHGAEGRQLVAQLLAVEPVSSSSSDGRGSAPFSRASSSMGVPRLTTSGASPWSRLRAGEKGESWSMAKGWRIGLAPAPTAPVFRSRCVRGAGELDHPRGTTDEIRSK
jgi:hypothetical protein